MTDVAELRRPSRSSTLLLTTAVVIASTWLMAWLTTRVEQTSAQAHASQLQGGGAAASALLQTGLLHEQARANLKSKDFRSAWPNFQGAADAALAEHDTALAALILREYAREYSDHGDESDRLDRALDLGGTVLKLDADRRDLVGQIRDQTFLIHILERRQAPGDLDETQTRTTELTALADQAWADGVPNAVTYVISAHTSQASLLEQQGQASEAVTTLTKALEASDADDDVGRSASIHFRIGELQLDLGDWAQAGSSFKAASDGWDAFARKREAAHAKLEWGGRPISELRLLAELGDLMARLMPIERAFDGAVPGEISLDTLPKTDLAELKRIASEARQLEASVLGAKSAFAETDSAFRWLVLTAARLLDQDPALPESPGYAAGDIDPARQFLLGSAVTLSQSSPGDVDEETLTEALNVLRSAQPLCNLPDIHWRYDLLLRLAKTDPSIDPNLIHPICP